MVKGCAISHGRCSKGSRLVQVDDGSSSGSSNLSVSGIKLLQSLVVVEQVLQYFLPDGSRVKSPCEGWKGLSTILGALQM